MSAAAPDRIAAAIDAIPDGTSTGTALGRRYVVSKSRFNQGRSVKLLAEALGGGDTISLNFYRLASGARLKPCEMPLAKATDFLLAFRADTAHGA